MKFSSVLQGIWDSKEKRFLGRTGRGWKEICLFFIIFYAIMISYFCATISFFYQFVHISKPVITGSQSFLQTPGLAMRPVLPSESGYTYTTLVRFSSRNDSQETKDCVENLRKALKPYKKAHEMRYATHWKRCTPTERPTDTQSCIINYLQLLSGGCSEALGYGFYEGKPCILLRLNNVYGWTPDPYTGPDDSMPDSLKRVVSDFYRSTAGDTKTTSHMVWVSCDGEDSIDKENIGRDIDYINQQGFPVMYFPYWNQIKHLAPAIMVKFNDLTPNVAVKVHCKAYARNIEIDTLTWSGSFHMELLYFKP